MSPVFSENLALALFALCFGLSLARAFRDRTRPWVILAFGCGCNLFAQAYWVGFMVVFGETPIYFYISDIGWAAQFLFIVMLLVECNIARAPNPPVSAAWAPVVVSAFLTIYYIYVGNNVIVCLVDGALIASIGYFAVKGLAAKPDEGALAEGGGRKLFRYNRVFAGMCLAFVVIELGLWTASCFYSEVPIAYDVFNYALFASHVGLIACAWGSEDI